MDIELFEEYIINNDIIKEYNLSLDDMIRIDNIGIMISGTMKHGNHQFFCILFKKDNSWFIYEGKFLNREYLYSLSSILNSLEEFKINQNNRTFTYFDKNIEYSVELEWIKKDKEIPGIIYLYNNMNFKFYKNKELELELKLDFDNGYNSNKSIEEQPDWIKLKYIISELKQRYYLL